MSDSNSIITAAKLSSAVYDVSGSPNDWDIINDARSESEGSGFDAVTYYNKKTNEVYIVYRGSEDAGDFSTDYDLGVGTLSSQFGEATDFYDSSMEVLSDRGITPSAPIITGAAAKTECNT